MALPLLWPFSFLQPRVVAGLRASVSAGQRLPSRIKGHLQFFVTWASQHGQLFHPGWQGREKIWSEFSGKMESHVTQRNPKRDSPSPAISYCSEPTHKSHTHSKTGNYSRAEYQNEHHWESPLTLSAMILQPWNSPPGCVANRNGATIHPRQLPKCSQQLCKVLVTSPPSSLAPSPMPLLIKTVWNPNPALAFHSILFLQPWAYFSAKTNRSHSQLNEYTL